MPDEAAGPVARNTGLLPPTEPVHQAPPPSPAGVVLLHHLAV